MRKFTIWLTCLLFFVSMGIANAQSKVITGTVTGADDGLPIPGVTIMVPGTTVGTTTNFDGNYELRVDEGVTVLRFSFVGMTPQDITIGNRTVINVEMAMSAEVLDEVVVTALGISRQTKALGYSVSTVKEDQLEQKAEPDLIRNLAGKVAGVDISSSGGAPGSSTRITIRGNSSFYGNNQPLFVVDGIPYSNTNFTTSDFNSGGGAYASGISTLDPNDIKSMTVLKGAAAAALYGSRAANGVVVVETKSGNAEVKKGVEIILSSSYSTEEISNIPEYQNTYGNGTDFSYANANGSWGPRFDSRETIPTWPTYLAAFPEMGPTIPYVAQPDNVKSIFKTGTVLENSVTINGGSENTSVSMTASMLDNDGYIPWSSFKKKSVNFGGNTKLSNGIVLNGSMSYTTSTQVGGRFGNNQSSSAGTASSFARTLWLGRTWDMSLPYEHPITGGPLNWNGVAQYDHPLWSMKHNTITTYVDRIVFNLGLSYAINDFLNVSATFGSNTYSMRRQEIIDIGSRTYDGLGALTDDDARTNEIEGTFLLAFNKDIAKDIHLDASAGFSLNQRNQDRQSFFGTNLVAPGIFDLDNANVVVPNGGTYYLRRLYGAFYDLSFSYKNFVYLNVTGRNDWSSTLPEANRSYFYPAFSASFLLTEAFDIESDVLSFAKLRAGWAKVGNDAGPYLVNTVYATNPTDVYGNAIFPFNGIAGQTIPNTLLNPNLTPEFTKELEFGADFALFSNKVRLDITWYNKITSDQIVTINIPASSGYSFYHTNAGEITNTGWEIGLDLTPVELNNGFKWNMYTTFTKNISEVTALPEGTERITLAGLFGDPSPVFEVGEAYGILRGSHDYRDDNGNLLIDPATGLMILADDNQTIGDPNPDFKLGVTNTFSYKGLSLSFLFNYTHGGDLWSNSIVSLLGRGVTKDTEDREHSWIVPGVYGDPNTGEALLDSGGDPIPNITQVTTNDLYFGESFAINAAGEWGVYDATILRLSNVSLSYDIPKKLLNKLPISGIKVTFTGNNLWFYTPNLPKYCNFDPEMNGYGNTNTQGVEYSNAPSVRRFGVNVKITL